MNHLQLAFIIGLFGSLHCVGMCGPLAFAIPNVDNGKWKLVLNKFLYQIGRAFSYAILGLLIGLLGKSLWIAGFQQTLSIICGVSIVIYSIFRLLPVKRNLNTSFPLINKWISSAIQKRYGHFAVGMLNGILPCAFVYVALATASNTSNIFQSALFMFFFGLGTLPLMFASAIGISFASQTVRRSINSAFPVLSLVLGVWLILRGLALDIPFLSPLLLANETICR